MSSIPHPGTGQRRLRGLAVAACVLVWLAAAPGPIAVFMSSFTFGWNARTDEARAGMMLLGGGLLTLFLGCAVAGVVVITWLWRARVAAAAGGGVPLQWSEGWVIGGWFVPLGNLVIPMLVVSDVVRVITGGSAAPRSARLARIVPLWWMGWIGGWMALWVAPSLLPTRTLENVAGVYLFFALFSGVSALLFIGSAAAFTHIAMQVSELLDDRALTPGPPMPGPATGPHLPPPPPPPPPSPRPSSGGSTWLPLAIIGAVVVIGVPMIALVAGGDEPSDVVGAVVDDVRDWKGANYRGTVVAPDGGEIDVDVTVTAAGAKGTLSRDGGRARAEVVRDRAGILLKGNQEWWRHSYPGRAEQLADSWVADPMAETMFIDRMLELDPAELSSRFDPESALWREIGEEHVDGQRGVRISDGFVQLIVTADEPYRLLVIDLQSVGSARPQLLRVTVVLQAQAAEVDTAASRIRSAESPRSLLQRLSERPRVDVQLQPEPMCRTARCTVRATVVNTGELTVVGRIEITADGVLAATYPVHLRPGQTATFTASTANAVYNMPGATDQVYWEAKVRND
jgi:Domain of unknown function (DUF4328)